MSTKSDDLNTQMYVDLTLMETVDNVMRAFAVAAFHAGNWQKPFGPEEAKPFTEKIKELSRQELLTRIEESLPEKRKATDDVNQGFNIAIETVKAILKGFRDAG